MTSPIDDILRRLPVDQLARQLGTDPAEVDRAAREAIPALIGGLETNANDAEQEQSIARALVHHETSPLAGEGEVALDQVDTEDGSKIVRHIFGDDADQTVHALSGSSGASSDLVRKLLPILAPIVLAYLAQRITGQKGAGGSGGGILGQILQGALGGGAQAGPAGGGMGGGMLGSILGQILRGGR